MVSDTISKIVEQKKRKPEEERLSRSACERATEGFERKR